MPKVAIKPGTLFDRIAPAGARILEVLKQLSSAHTITITSGTDGTHSGPTDPHYEGAAYDIRTNNLTPNEVQLLLTALQKALGPRFYAFVEGAGNNVNTTAAHIHVQRTKGSTYTIEDYFNA